MTPRFISELYYETQLDGQQSGKLPFFVCFLFVCLFFFTVIMELSTVCSKCYSLERLVPPAHVSHLSSLFIRCVGETTSSVRKVSGKGVAKTIVGWLACMCYLSCQLLVIPVSKFSVIHNTKKVV